MRRVTFVLALWLMGCGSTDSRSTLVTSGVAEVRGLQSYVSSDGLHFEPGPPRDTAGLTPLSWRETHFKAGRLVLSGLGERRRGTRCHEAVLMHVGTKPRDVRTVVVWGQRATIPCRDNRDRVALDPPGWTASTIATRYAIHAPNPHALKRQREAAVHGSAVLQPDRRTIVVDFEYGGCHEFARARAHLRGSRVTVSAVVGMDSRSDETVCPLVLSYGAALVRLPRQVPAAVTVTVARKGSRR